MEKSASGSSIDPRWIMAGYAILCRDESTGQPYWHTYNGEGSDECKLSLRQPVTFPTTKLPLTSLIRVYIPKGSDNEQSEKV